MIQAPPLSTTSPLGKIFELTPLTSQGSFLSGLPFPIIRPSSPPTKPLPSTWAFHHYTPAQRQSSTSVTDLPRPLSVQATSEKIAALKRRAQKFARDQRLRDDVQISYLEMLEVQDNDNLWLVQMIAQ
jgi:hypothetical protein